MKLKLGIGVSVVYLLALLCVFAWMSTPGNTQLVMLPPFVLSFGLIGLVAAWVLALIGNEVHKAAKVLGGGDEEQKPFSRCEYANNFQGSAAWEARQKTIRQQRQQTQPTTLTESNQE